MKCHHNCQNIRTPLKTASCSVLWVPTEPLWGLVLRSVSLFEDCWAFFWGGRGWVGTYLASQDMPLGYIYNYSLWYTHCINQSYIILRFHKIQTGTTYLIEGHSLGIFICLVPDTEIVWANRTHPHSWDTPDPNHFHGDTPDPNHFHRGTPDPNHFHRDTPDPNHFHRDTPDPNHFHRDTSDPYLYNWYPYLGYPIAKF